MDEAAITVRGKSTTVKYRVVDKIGLQYARVEFQSGDKYFFYRGMYGNEKKWENRCLRSDLVDVLSDPFNSVEAVNLGEHDTNLETGNKNF
ncbi:hypothetical protein ACFOET_18600 [Parapedobacter deserti]|uniref:Uncharacterized protein n=1 Tax=Parapedobacter deserti TaxID=1912957 RepID=A0ABV7JS72_9SPHI